MLSRDVYEYVTTTTHATRNTIRVTCVRDPPLMKDSSLSYQTPLEVGVERAPAIRNLRDRPGAQLKN